MEEVVPARIGFVENINCKSKLFWTMSYAGSRNPKIENKKKSSFRNKAQK